MAAAPARQAAGAADLRGRRAAVIALSYYPWDPRIRRETEALADLGLAIDLYCLQEDVREPQREEIKGVQVRRMRLRRARTSRTRYFFEYLGFFVWGFWNLTVASLRHRYALVHVHNVPDLLVFTSIVPRLRGARIILDLHDPMPELFRTIFGLGPKHPFVRLLTWSERMSAMYADVVLTPNRGFLNLFIRRTRLPRKFNIIMNSPADEIFRPRLDGRVRPEALSADRPFRLMYHGLIAQRHGLDVLIHAVNLLVARIPQVQLDIYGAANPYLPKVLALISELRLESRIRYHGKKSLSEIAALIEGIDLGIVPNRRTPFTEINFPTRIFEYLALHKPVIVLNTAGVRDYFTSDEIFFFDSDQPAALAEVIGQIHRHPDRALRVVERGRAVYEQHRWRDEKLRFAQLVSQLLEAPPPANAAAAESGAK